MYINIRILSTAFLMILVEFLHDIINKMCQTNQFVFDFENTLTFTLLFSFFIVSFYIWKTPFKKLISNL